MFIQQIRMLHASCLTLLPPATKLRQGNVFTPWTETPWTVTPRKETPPSYGNERAVRILLECILVSTVNRTVLFAHKQLFDTLMCLLLVVFICSRTRGTQGSFPPHKQQGVPFTSSTVPNWYDEAGDPPCYYLL